MKQTEGINFTDQELLHLNGTLPAERLEHLIESSENYEALEDESGAIDDAIAQYPEEDFLTDIKARVLTISKNTRGRNRADLEALLEALNDLEMTTYYASEFGIKTLRELADRLP